MSGTLVSLIDFLGTRAACPVCGAARSPTTMPTQWSMQRAVFDCEAVFLARGEAILAERACGSDSKRAATLWTIEAASADKPAPGDEDDGA
jgi:hypothetical protein